MPNFLNPTLTVAEAGRVLEPEFVQRFGEEYERLYRTFDLQLQEQSTNQEAQVYACVGLIGATTDQTNLFLSLVWLSKKQMSDPTAQAMLEVARAKTVAQLIDEAQNAVRKP